MTRNWEHLDLGQRQVCRALWPVNLTRNSYLDYEYEVLEDGTILSRKYLLENCEQFFTEQRHAQYEFERQMKYNRI